MRDLILYVHGLSAPGSARRARIARRLDDEACRLGVADPSVEVFEWRSGDPLGATALGAAVGTATSALLRFRLPATIALAATAATAGVALSYRAARSEVDAAATRLADRLRAAAQTHRTVQVVAHSLGSEVVLAALRRLSATGHGVPGTIVLLAGTARADRDWSHEARVPAGGIRNVRNPIDVALLAERVVRSGPAIGTHPMVGAGVMNVATRRGHAMQLGRLAEILVPHRTRVDATIDPR